MKHLLTTMVITAFLFSCGGGKSGDKTAQLEKLKKQQAEIAEQIKKLEREMPLDTAIKSIEKMRNVGVTKITYQPFRHFIEVMGKVDADENVAVNPKMPGTIAKVLVSAGDIVTAGQVLAEMDAQVIRNGIEEIKTQWAFANNLFEKQKNLWEQKIGTEMQYLSAKNNKDAIEKKMATLEEQLEMTKIKSPIDGTVDEVSVKIGQAVMPGISAVRVVNFSKLKVKAEVAESYIRKIKKGNNVLIFFPDLNKEMNASVTYTANVINPLNRTFNVEIVLKPMLDLHPNMMAVLKVIDMQKEAAVVIPVNVIQHADNGKYVMVAAIEQGKNVAKKRLITENNSYNGLAEISSGLNPGDILVTTGYQDLNDGDLINF